MYDLALYQHHYQPNQVMVHKPIAQTFTYIPSFSVMVYFENLGKSIPVTLKLFDQLLHEGSLVNILNKWIAI